MNQDLQYEINAAMPAVIGSGIFTSLITIQAPDALSSDGAPAGTYTNVPNHVDIPCANQPAASASVDVTEIKALMDIMSKGCKHVLLSGYYPAIELGWRAGWRGILDGVAYDILGAESDSQNIQTRMELRLVTL